MLRLHQLQGGLCAHCRTKIEAIGRDDMRPLTRPNDPSLDHAIPRSRRGSSGLHNLLLTHRRCNIARRNEELSEAAREVWRANLIKLGLDPSVVGGPPLSVDRRARNEH